MNFPKARDFWNQRFEREGYLFGTEPNRFLVSQRHLLAPGMQALSVADGEGRNSVWLAGQGLEVTAVEFSPVAVEKARRLAGSRGVSPRLHVADVFEWEWPRERFDIVAAIFIQFAAPGEREPLFGRMKEALKPGGHLVLQGYTPKQLDYRTGGPPHVENLYTEALLREAFADFDIVHLREHEDELAEGDGHRGRSALIDLVARRPERT
ncbi:MAG: class I SAM-dependent methyltransferase [Rhodocyclaceae bacterium]